MKTRMSLKSAITALLVSLSTIVAMAQQPPREIMEYAAKQSALESRFDSLLYKCKDYVKAEQVMLELVSSTKGLPDSIQAKFRPAIDETLANLYYNGACMYSLAGRKATAVEWLSLAADYGWSDVAHAAIDNDLNNVRDMREYNELIERVYEASNPLVVLRKGGEYRVSERRDTLPEITYSSPDAPGLIAVRNFFHLDSIAGNGDEISRIKNLLSWVHNTIQHDGMHPNPESCNALGMWEACSDGSRGLNCRGLATFLNECYLALGFKSRFITCMPRDFKGECHVINTVYSDTLKRWIWIDPTHESWVTDGNGNLIGVKEFREMRIGGGEYNLNENANWNNREASCKEYYLDDYMTRNTYSIVIPTHFGFDTEAGRCDYVILVPENAALTGHSKYAVATTDADWFWTAP